MQQGGETNLINFRYKFNFLPRAEKYLLNEGRLTPGRVSRWRRLPERSGLTHRNPASPCQGSAAAHKKLPLFPPSAPADPGVCVCQNRDSGSAQRRIGTFERCQRLDKHREIYRNLPSQRHFRRLPEQNSPLSVMAGLPADHLINMG